MTPAPIRCAIYTRKSSEEGLEQAFNSLDAQREACAAYIQSQKHEGWQPDLASYDDGGISGGTLERPALQRLLQEVREHRVDVIVVYKVDRLTRSLADFSKIVDILDAHNASFVSVTQQFNTSTSMGRPTLNVLLSFAQFEREVTGERIRDKLAATARKGMRPGGNAPLGYDLQDRALIVNKAEARAINHIFERYIALGSVSKLKAELDKTGYLSKARVSKKGIRPGGLRFAKGGLYRILQNQVYLGKIVHNGTVYPGNHDAITGQDLFDRVQRKLVANRAEAKLQSRAKNPSLLSGLLFDDRGNAFSPSHAVKNGKRYRYYVNQALIQFRPDDAGEVRRVAAHEVEQLLVNKFLSLVGNHAILGNHLAVPSNDHRVLTAVKAGARRLVATWGALGTREQKRIIQRVVSLIVICAKQVDVVLSRQGLADALGIKLADGSGVDQFEISVDAQFRRIGGETKLVLEGKSHNPPANTPDPVLLHALAQAHAWNEIYRRTPTLPMVHFARIAGISETYATRILRLAYLAPDITEAILAGKQPRSLTLKRLLRGVPLDWNEQRERFGVRAS